MNEKEEHMMKTKANIRRNRRGQGFELTVHLKGDAATLVHLKPLVSELRHHGSPRWLRGTRDPWETPFWFMLGVYALVFLGMLTRAAL